ncbi:MAG: enoyl-CoA hydratase [Pseudomonadota bacterium]
MSDPTDGVVDVHLQDHGEDRWVAHVIVNRPRRLNALDQRMADALAESLAGLRDTDARAVVLTGAGDRAFIGGADVNLLKTLKPATARRYISSIHAICAEIRQCQVPVVARVNGFCLGAGLEIAAACDIRVAEGSAILGMPEVKVGLPSVVEAALLPQLIGWGRARWLLLTGENISAETGADWGLIEVLAQPGMLDLAVAKTLASLVEAAPGALRTQKALINEWEKLSLTDAIERGIDVFEASYAESDEPTRYVNAFLSAHEKRRRG